MATSTDKSPLAGPAERNTFWDLRYGEPGLAYGAEPNDFLVSVADRIPPGPVLCLAAGEGRNAVFLAGRGHQVVAVDASGVGLAKTRDLASAHRAEVMTVQVDLADYPIEHGRWAAIVFIFSHLPQPLRSRVHAAAVRGLRPGGALVMEAFAPAQLRRDTGGPRSRGLLYPLPELREAFAELDLSIARQVVRDVHEGPYHDGRATVVQILGFRPE